MPFVDPVTRARLPFSFKSIYRPPSIMKTRMAAKAPFGCFDKAIPPLRSSLSGRGGSCYCLKYGGHGTERGEHLGPECMALREPGWIVVRSPSAARGVLPNQDLERQIKAHGLRRLH